MKLLSRVFVILLSTLTFIACNNNASDNSSNTSSEIEVESDGEVGVPIATVRPFPDCYTKVSVKKNTYHPELKDYFDDDVEFSESFVNESLKILGYQVIGDNAHKYERNVVVYISVHESLKKASISYFQWSMRSYPTIFPTDGDALILKNSKIPVNAQTFDEALEQALGEVKNCRDL